MDVIGNYFRTLRIFLPKDQRDDILRELTEEVQSHVAEQEGALGRPLNADEQAAIVGQFGHPLVTAARYRPQRYLIGPIVFPYYWIVLKTVLALIAAGHLIGAVLLLAGGATIGQMGQILEGAIETALKATGWITALGAFADFSFSRSRALDKWQPSATVASRGRIENVIRGAIAHVPGAHHAHQWSESRPSHSTEPSVWRFVISLVCSVWWLAALRWPFLFFGPGAADLQWGPAMDRLYPVLFLAQLTTLAEQFVALIRSEQTAIVRVTRWVWLLAGWALIYAVATSDHQWMVWQGEAATRASATIMRLAARDISLSAFVNYVWSIVFIFVAIVAMWGSIKAILHRVRRIPTAAHA